MPSRDLTACPLPDRLKHPPCPVCGAPEVVAVLLGYPSREAEEWARRGEVRLVGCEVYQEPFRSWHCWACGSSWNSAEEAESEAENDPVAPYDHVTPGYRELEWCLRKAAYTRNEAFLERLLEALLDEPERLEGFGYLEEVRLRGYLRQALDRFLGGETDLSSVIEEARQRHGKARPGG